MKYNSCLFRTFAAIMEENIITSPQNAHIKHVVALQQKSSLRRKEGLFVVEGRREIEHCIECGYEVVELFIVDGLQLTVDYPACPSASKCNHL
jgi:TrmH family RNA methyltransferase